MAKTTIATVTTTFPMLPVLSAQEPNESVHEYGARALRFLLDDRAGIVTSDNRTLELAMMVSQGVVTARDMHDTARERLRVLRLDIIETMRRRAALDKETPAPKPAAPKPPKPGPQRVPVLRPVPSLPPSGALRGF